MKEVQISRSHMTLERPKSLIPQSQGTMGSFHSHSTRLRTKRSLASKSSTSVLEASTLWCTPTVLRRLRRRLQLRSSPDLRVSAQLLVFLAWKMMSTQFHLRVPHGRTATKSSFLPPATNVCMMSSSMIPPLLVVQVVRRMSPS